MSQQIRNQVLVALAMAAGAAVIAPSAVAAAAADKDALDEVVVTATKRETNLQKTSISIQTVSGEELESEGKKRIDDIMRGVVGVASQGSQVGTSFFMRGLGMASGPQPSGTSQAVVAVLIDGVYQNRGEAVRGGTLDVQRAEVMRGTQSTTLGAASLAGAVSLVSAQPVFQHEGRASIEFGNYNLFGTEGMLNMPLADNQALRFAFSTNKRDGYISSSAGDSDLVNARVKYRIKPSDDLDIVLTASQNRIGGNGVDASVLTYGGHWEPYVAGKDRQRGGACAAGCYDVTMGTMFGHINDGTTYRDRSNPWDDGYPADKWPNSPFRHTTINQYSADINWRLPIGNLTIKPSYQHAHFLSEEPPRGTDWRSEDRLQITKQVDAQLTSNGEGPLQWLVGTYWYDTNLEGTMRGAGLPGFGAGPGPACASTSATQNTYCWSFDHNTQKTKSIYGNGSYTVMDGMRVIGGVRYSKDTKTFLNKGDGAGTISGIGPAGFGPTGSGEKSWSAVTYRGGLEYDVTPDSMAYATYSTGYQAGNIFAFVPTGTPKETLEQITLGFKSRWFDNRLQFNIEAFDSTYHDRSLDGTIGVEVNPQFAPPFPACSVFPFPTPAFYDPGSGYACYQVLSAIVPDLHSKGVDTEINWLITPDDRLDLNFEYLKSTTTTPTGVPSQAGFNAAMGAVGLTNATLLGSLYTQLAGLATSYNGLTLQNSPKWSGNFSYSHTFRLPGGSELQAKFNLEYKDDYWSLGGAPGANIANPGKSAQASYTMSNAYLNWVSSTGKWTVNAYVKNLGDKVVQTNYSPPFGGGAEYVTLAPPRTFGVVVSANF